MTFNQQAFAVIAAFLLLGIVFALVLWRRLREEYTVLWVLMSLVVLVLVLWYDALLFVTGLIGATLATTTLFLFGILFVMLIELHYSVKISELSERVKILAQRLALLEHDQRAFLENHVQAPVSASPADNTDTNSPTKPEQGIHEVAT